LKINKIYFEKSQIVTVVKKTTTTTKKKQKAQHVTGACKSKVYVYCDEFKVIF
jgi:hypothetical protein